MLRTSIIAGLLLGLLVPAPANAADLVFVKAAKIYSGDAGLVYSPGTMLIDGSQVVAVGSDLTAPVGAKVLDFGNAVIMPGVVAATSSLGGSILGDDSVAAHLHALDGFQYHGDYRRYLLGGVTTAYLSCGTRRLVSGQGAVVKLAGANPERRLLSERTHLEINLGTSSLRPPPKQEIPIPPSSDNPFKPAVRQLPTTRLGQWMGLREAFKAAGQATTGDVPLYALREAIERGATLRIHATDRADLERAVSIARELGLKAVISGGDEAASASPALIDAGLPVIFEVGLALDRPPVDRAYSKDNLVLEPKAAGVLSAAGIKVALAIPAAGGNLEEIMLSGSVAMRGGMHREQAVAALTSVAAEVLGVDSRVGTLAAGRDADFLVLGGEPFSRGGHVNQVFVDGVEVASLAAVGMSSSAYVIRAGTILVGDGTQISDGEILLEDGKIAAIGRRVSAPPGATTLDAGPDAVVTPGFLDSNSQLEFGIDRSSYDLSKDLTHIVAYASDDSLEVARSGVTTTLLQSYTAHSTGSRVVPVKTAGSHRKDRVVDDLAGVKFSWTSREDPLATRDKFAGVLKAGKAYHDQWVKYHEELEKWEKAQAENVGKPKPVAEKPEEEEPEEEVSKEQRADPLTGKWECQLSGGPIPEPMPAELNLKLKEGQVSGTFSGAFGGDDATEVSGTFSGTHLSATISMETPFGPPTLEAEVKGDTMDGTFAIGDQIQLEISGKRTEKVFTEVTVVSRRAKKTDDDGRPQPPTVQEKLEPYRRLFAGEVPVLLEADAAIALREAVKVFVDEYKLDLVIMGGEGLDKLGDDVWGKLKGVVVPTQIRLRSGKTLVTPAVQYSRGGHPVGFQSHGGTAARGLGMNAAYAVRHGMGPNAALSALTLDPAKMFKIDDRVGSLATGKDADVLVFSGDPFDLSSRLLHVFVNGEAVEMEEDS